ncbi:MAG: glycoside hydrolase family 13 protein [Clostridia bacterium]|nr:glycoside hydrolase family 13 protein [Clostridia bacterium]
MENYIFNPINNKSPKGAIVKGQEVTYTLKVSKFTHPTEVFFVMHKDGAEDKYYKMHRLFADERYIHYEFRTIFVSEGFYWYHFEVRYQDNYTKLIRSSSLDAVPSYDNSDYLQLVIRSESETDKSFKQGIIYHIFVDRFCRVGDVTPRDGLKLMSDWNKLPGLEFNSKGERCNVNCYGGNFDGIISKLDYLKDLNVSTIYLSPIFEANSSHKYDVGDYSTVESMFGGLDGLKSLIKECKRRHINIIIDGVFNHTGSDSVYFNKEGRYKTIGAYQSQNSKYYSWYDFSEYPDEYSSWWGIKTLPQTNENSGFFDYISGKNGIINKYMRYGIDGLRLDVADELTNNFLYAIGNAVRTVKPKALIVGEVWEDASSKISYDERKEYFLGGNLDSVTNYPIKNAILEFIKYRNEQPFVNIVNLMLDQYPKSIRDNLMNILDTHDTQRALTFLGADFSSDRYSYDADFRLSQEEKELGKKLLKLATILQYTVVGIPTVYYGDEAGLEGNRDPYCRATYPWGKEDIDLVEWYQKLGNLRNNPVLVDGDMFIRYAEDSVVLFERIKDDEKVIVAVNRSDNDFEFITTRRMCNFFTGEYVDGNIIVPPDSAVVLI